MKYSQIKNLCKSQNLKPTELDLEDFLICTEEEATERVEIYIQDNLWAFNTDFLRGHISSDISEEEIDALKAAYSEKALKALIKDWDHFVDDAIRADGLGHFLNSYDGEEVELGDDLYAYRTN